MKNQTFRLDEENRKTIGFNDDHIIISSKKHQDFESLLASQKKSGLMESVKTIPIKSIQKLRYNNKEDLFSIHYNNEKGKTKKDQIKLADSSLKIPFIEAISELKGFQKEEVSESKTQPLLINIGITLLAVAFTWIARGMAIDAMHGEHYQATGRKSGLKNLMAGAIESLGPTWTVVIGAIITIYLAYRAYNRYQNPGTVITYQ
ncbi:MAG: hypothetical protein AAFZ15_16890 [Bacteroidota bacterium]